MANGYNYDSEQGIISPNTQELLAKVQAQWASIFGASLSLDASTLQGRIIEEIVASQKATANNMALIANQLNPDYATGVYLDAIGSYLGVERIQSTATIAFYVAMGGVAGTEIPAGAQARDTQGNLYTLSDSVKLDSSGKALGTFVCDKHGAIVLPPNTLTQPIIPAGSTYSGWQSVSNGNFGTVGTEEESDADYRIRIKISKAINATSMVSSLESALYEINGLKSYSYYENYTSDTETNDPNDERKKKIPVGESVSPHSIFLFVQGGTADTTFYQQVAKALLTKKSGGCGMQASVAFPDNVHNITITDAGSPYVMTFNTPQPIPIYVKMTVRNVSYTGTALTSDVQSVIMNWFAGNLNTVANFGIGVDISAFDLSAVVSSQLGVVVQQCLIGTSPNPTTSNLIPITMNKIGTVSESAISIVVG